MEIKGQGLCSQARSDSESQQRALRRNASLPSEHDLGESCVYGGGGIGHQSRFREVECGARRGVSGFRSTWRGVMETRPGRAARSSVMEGAWLGHHGMRRFRGGNMAVGNVCSIGCVWKQRGGRYDRLGSSAS